MNSLDRSNQETVAVMYSGGFDSTVLVVELLRQGCMLAPIYIQSDLCWQRAELEAANKMLKLLQPDWPHLRQLTVLDLPLADVYLDHWSATGQRVPSANSEDEAVYLPGRNPLLLIKAAVWCAQQRIHEIALGMLACNPFPDATEQFFHSFEETINLALGWRIRIKAPLARYTKEQVASLGVGLPLEATFSCLSPIAGQHCGDCNKCAERGRVISREEVSHRPAAEIAILT